MAKNSSSSSRPARLVIMTSEDIKNRKWTDDEVQAMGYAAERQAAGDDSDIDYSDIPQLTEQQLASMVRLREVQRKLAVSAMKTQAK